MEREIPNTLQAHLYLHCGKCLNELPKGISAREYSQLEVGYTKLGFQVWCRRHECNVMHVDFQGQTHPANLTAADGSKAKERKGKMINKVKKEKLSTFELITNQMIEKSKENFERAKGIDNYGDMAFLDGLIHGYEQGLVNYEIDCNERVKEAKV